MIGAAVDRTPTARLRRLATKLLGDPVVPVLAWTKAVELTVLGDENALAFLAFGVVSTAVWVVADDIRERAEDVAEEVAETADEVADRATDGGEAGARPEHQDANPGGNGRKTARHDADSGGE